jgi:hypothetical protein
MPSERSVMQSYFSHAIGIHVCALCLKLVLSEDRKTHKNSPNEHAFIHWTCSLVNTQKKDCFLTKMHNTKYAYPSGFKAIIPQTYVQWMNACSFGLFLCVFLSSDKTNFRHRVHSIIIHTSLVGNTYSCIYQRTYPISLLHQQT